MEEMRWLYETKQAVFSPFGGNRDPVLGILAYVSAGGRGRWYFPRGAGPWPRGQCPGAVYDGVEEKDINLQVALRVEELLEDQENLSVRLTRGEDTDLGLYERAQLANDAGADLFVSIHSNALEQTDYEGIFTYFWTSKSEQAAQVIQNAVVDATGGVDRGVRSEEFVVIRETKMPAVLVEMGFMTCPEELERLIDPDYQDKLAQGLVDGILALQAQAH